MMIKDSDLETGLPKKTKSMCPECKKVIEADLLEEKGKVVMKKTCPEHGDFKDTVWSDAEYYLWAEQYATDGIGVVNPKITKENPDCPNDCGLCYAHKSHTVLANLDLTNRCNLTCPICFANANSSGFVCEPDFETIVKMMEELRNEEPIPCHAIQFAGGEPTIYPRFLDVLRKARELGFPQVQIATNGIRFAEDPKFVQDSMDAGLNTVYLQFDGFDDEMYKKVRGYPMVAIKRKALDYIRNTKGGHMSVCLVPTIVNNVNDHEVGKIAQFAVENADIVHAVNYQPVSFAGRINKKELEEQRFTIPDLVDRISKQFPILEKKDFYPVPAMTSLSEIVAVLHETPKVTFSSHPHCGVGTFIFVGPKGEITPITHFVKVSELLKDMKEMAAKTEEKQKKGSISYKIMKKAGKTKLGKRIAAGKLLKKYIIKDKVQEYMDIEALLKPLFEDGDKGSLATFTWNALMLGGMHFQDLYNYDISRVMRCVIHYVTPDLRIIPFCAYNAGPTYRVEVESTCSLSAKEWKEQNKGRTIVEPSPLLQKLKAERHAK
jgi:uncharacterized radical SAM superfamily Fe-S cluster-containing enzyme